MADDNWKTFKINDEYLTNEEMITRYNTLRDNALQLVHQVESLTTIAVIEFFIIIGLIVTICIMDARKSKSR